MGTIDTVTRGPSTRLGEWTVGLTVVLGVAAGGFGLATMNVSRPLTIGATSLAAAFLGVAAVTAVWRLRRAAGWVSSPHRRRLALSIGGLAAAAALLFVSVSVVSGMSGWTPRGWLREVLTGSGQLASLPLNTSPPLQAELYFGAISTIVNTVLDAPDFAADYALAQSQPDLCATVVVASDLEGGFGSVAVAFSGAHWRALDSVVDGDIGGLPFIRQSLMTPPGREPIGAQSLATVTVREDQATATGQYSVELLGASGAHRLWAVGSGGHNTMVECTVSQPAR